MSDLDRFAHFAASVLTTEDGSPLILEPFQRATLAEHFGRVHELLILMPKKLGKSSLLAGRGLFELCTVPYATVAIAAASRDQAGLILKQASGYIRRSPALRRRLSVVQREICHAANGGTMKVLAADSDTLDGWLGNLALVDELGRWGSAENYGLLRAGVVPRNGQLIGIRHRGRRRGFTARQVAGEGDGDADLPRQLKAQDRDLGELRHARMVARSRRRPHRHQLDEAGQPCELDDPRAPAGGARLAELHPVGAPTLSVWAMDRWRGRGDQRARVGSLRRRGLRDPRGLLNAPPPSAAPEPISPATYRFLYSDDEVGWEA